MTLRVLVAGAGLGGLTLAHSLRATGCHVSVFEPSHTPPPIGYRIEIDAGGSRALHACLPPDLWHAFVQHSARPPRGIAFASEQLARLAFVPAPDPTLDPVGHDHPISRAGLRTLLLRGLDDVVVDGKRVTGYRSTDAEVEVFFADGTSARGDVLVGADGSSSAVRRQLLPDARVVDSGVAGIAGKVYLTDRTLAHIPETLLTQMTMVLPMRGGRAMFMAGFLPSSDDVAEDIDLPPHLFWTVIGQPESIGLLPGRRQAGAELKQITQRAVADWHPLLRWLVDEASPSDMLGIPLYTAEPVAPWPTGNVTLLGDAVHTMTPLQGLGGNTALRDAALLGQHLADVEHGRAELRAALHAYESVMLDYGFDAVERSLRVSEGVASTSVPGRLAFRAVLRTADRVPWLRERMFARPHAVAA
jgi:2-polyprenyl-6-methoxyphenol hydroxylase-like FAD-dependent oxidoreductase